MNPQCPQISNQRKHRSGGIHLYHRIEITSVLNIRAIFQKTFNIIQEIKVLKIRKEQVDLKSNRASKNEKYNKYSLDRFNSLRENGELGNR